MQGVLKKILAFILVLLMCFNIVPASAKGIEIYYDGEYHTYTGTLYDLYVNGKKLTVPLEPITFNNRSLVPIREVFEALGAEVEYIAKSKEIMITGNDTEVTLQIGNNTAYVNGKKVSIPDGVVPKLITKVGVETKTMVPVRFVSESIGLKVDFDGKAGAIKISGNVGEEPEKEPPKEEEPEVSDSVTIKAPVINKNNGTTTVIAIKFDKAIAKSPKASVTNAGVIYFDIPDAKYEGASKTEVNHASVLSVRYGLHEDYTRIAIDTKDYKSYNVVTSATKKQVTITVVAKVEDEDFDPDEEVPTEPEDEEKPDDSTKPDEEETPPEEPTVTVNIDALKKYTASKGIKYVVIDAGHGGKDSGAVGKIEVIEKVLVEPEETDETDEETESGQEPVYEERVVESTTYYEKNIALAVAKLVQKELQAEGIKVIMTRTGDTYPSLSERPLLANKNDAALFVSIHVNSATKPSANGIEVFYAEKNNHNYYGRTSKQVATTVYNNLISETGAFPRKVKTENHLVTRSSYMPAILVEIGFISNQAELEKMIDPAYQQKLANAISQGIITELDRIEVPDRRDLAEAFVAEQIGEEKAKEYMDKVWE